jgi:hypothetical protein
MARTPVELWARLEPIDEESVKSIEVEVSYDRDRSEKDKAPAEYVTLTRAQMERFLTEAGYGRVS